MLDDRPPCSLGEVAAALRDIISSVPAGCITWSLSRADNCCPLASVRSVTVLLFISTNKKTFFRRNYRVFVLLNITLREFNMLAKMTSTGCAKILFNRVSCLPSINFHNFGTHRSVTLKADIALPGGSPPQELRDVICHMGPQCYLPPDTSERAKSNPSHAGW